MVVRSPQAKRQRRHGREDPDDPISSESQQASLEVVATSLSANESAGGATELIGFADGACRGNPGRASWGAVLWPRNGRRSAKPLWESMGVLEGSKRTNNEAEYTGAIMCVEQAVARGATSLHLSLDSELVVKQYNGEYAVHSTTLKSLHQRLLDAAARLRFVQLHHVSRQLNAHADALANKALDEDAVASVSGSVSAPGCDCSSGRQLKPQTVSFLGQSRPTPPEFHSHSSFPGTQYPSDDDVLDDLSRADARNDNSEGPRAPVRSGHGRWRKLRDVTSEWLQSCHSDRGPFATVLGLVTHVMPPHEMPRRDGTGTFLMAKLKIEDGSGPEDRMEITLWRGCCRQVENVRCGDIVQISQVYFKHWEDRASVKVSVSGSCGEKSELLVACHAGDKPPQTGHLPLHRVYTRADLVGLYQWALTSAWRGYLLPQRPRAELAASEPRKLLNWQQQCATASELVRGLTSNEPCADEGELVSFAGRFCEESVVRFHRDRRATIELLEQEAVAEKHMPFRRKSVKLNDWGAAAFHRGVRLVITDVHNCEGSSSSSPGGRSGIANSTAGNPCTGRVVIAVHHQSKAIFHTAVGKDQCYCLTALRRAGQEESFDALEPVLHTTAATTLTPVDAPNNSRLLYSPSVSIVKPSRALTVLEVINIHATRATGAAVSCGVRDLNGIEQHLSVGEKSPHVTVPSLNCHTAGTRSEKMHQLVHDSDGFNEDDEDDEQDRTLSLDNVLLESDSEIDEYDPGRISGSPIPRGLMDFQTQGAGDSSCLLCTAYVQSIDLEASIPVAAPLQSNSRATNEMESANADNDNDVGWLSLLRWRCTRDDCTRQIPLTKCRQPFGGTKACDRCGGPLTLSLRDVSMVLSDCPRHCEHGPACTSNVSAGGEALTVAVLPCAMSSLFCGLLTPEQIYGDDNTSPHANNLGRAQAREAIWALCNSGTRVTLQLRHLQSDVGIIDSQGYGVENNTTTRGTAARYAVAAVDWGSALPLDWSCGCDARNSRQDA